jgi:D-glycero-alpha-D-manno-heptose-7-phosphate kinase
MAFSSAITQYVYTTIERPLQEGHPAPLQIERVQTSTRSATPSSARRCASRASVGPNIEITSMADIPAATGLGSPGSFTTFLLNVLQKFKKHFIHPHELAALACHIELDLLKEPIGKQDQYIASFGGATVLEIEKDGQGHARP